MVALHLLLPLATVIPFAWNLLGAIPLAVGLGINVIADGLFRRVHTTVKPFEESAMLVTDGPFRISRNPMYLGFALTLAGVAMVLGSLTPFIVLPVFVILIDRLFIVREEQMLAQRFGAAYLAYTQRTRRWI